ncbi:MAG: UvrD-helicase domain-containing protein [Lachnospiraceae bacterium]|jgi:superfamily I DNA/RNA helicase|nr:UvrD-helicase domain-containing protein [Lachnospiraceae bacterium]MCH4063785.1 UvrD-helicase domain-containing protein [Lachnospiraceae bacterium]MCH4103492.1 UvrD-helicase domain-containing protein [Lachnospiraceae bacterium]MCI1309845.1 UvrD-helicase domain-containing protein [Lachnospiraceae bacterium]MCI1334296.1 UvrD-helicase domain-containing protein [Lachnospiraceae bacterium]
MIINVAGAGAGKTTKMAGLVTRCKVPDGKIIFCIAFTNAAVGNITAKVQKACGEIPDNIKISTIHSFLYQELIKPFYYFLYGKQYEGVSVIDLPSDPRYKNKRISRLETEGLLHYTKIPERAKWVVYQKSGDRKATRDKRRRILNGFSEYCYEIFVDEAQDINDDLLTIFKALENAGVNIILYGDPKQDIKGTGCFRQLIEEAEEVKYLSECHRCPQIHLDLSNTIAAEQEQQVADETNSEGSINIYFQSDIDDINEFLAAGHYGLKYISSKRDGFLTHARESAGQRFNTVLYEISKVMAPQWNDKASDFALKQGAFYIAEQVIMNLDNGVSASNIIRDCQRKGIIPILSKADYAELTSVLQKKESAQSDIPVVQSIESVKGLEADRCLFILTMDLAPYLFRKKMEDNKVSHLLYVALTRSLDNLSILITKDVEHKYTRKYCMGFFAKYI